MVQPSDESHSCTWEEQAVMERHQPGGVSDSQGSVAHGARSVVGKGLRGRAQIFRSSIKKTWCVYSIVGKKTLQTSSRS